MSATTDPIAAILAIPCPTHGSHGRPCLLQGRDEGYVCLARVRAAHSADKSTPAEDIPDRDHCAGCTSAWMSGPGFSCAWHPGVQPSPSVPTACMHSNIRTSCGAASCRDCGASVVGEQPKPREPRPGGDVKAPCQFLDSPAFPNYCGRCGSHEASHRALSQHTPKDGDK